MSIILGLAQQILQGNPASTSAGIITAAASVITGVSLLIGALTVFVPVLRATRRVEKQVATVHTIVNQQRTDAQRYNIALTELLKKNGIEVPVDQSLPVVGEPDAQPGQPS